MDLVIITRVVADTVSLIPVGEIDLSCSVRLDQAQREALRTPGVAEVVVDLDQVSFIDSIGLRSLLDGHRLAHAAGLRHRVANAHGLVAHTLDVTGLADILNTDGPAGSVR